MSMEVEFLRDEYYQDIVSLAEKEDYCPSSILMCLTTFSDKFMRGVVLLENKKVCGFLLYFVRGNTLNLRYLLVGQEFRGKGYSRMLVNKIRVPNITILIKLDQNNDPISLWMKLGFVRTDLAGGNKATYDSEEGRRHLDICRKAHLHLALNKKQAERRYFLAQLT